MLEHFAPVCVIADASGEILYFQGRTSDFLEPVQGTPNYNLIGMARDGLKAELNVAFRKAVKQRQETVIRDLRLRTGRWAEESQHLCPPASGAGIEAKPDPGAL